MTCGKIDLACTKCRLSKGRTRVVPGAGSCTSPIVFIGEAPGREEDSNGEPFVGRGGKLLDAVLKGAGVDRSDVYISNLVKCRPPNNRRPRKDEIETCLQYLESELKVVRPKVICALGQTAANHLLNNNEKMAHLVKKDSKIVIGETEVRLFVAYHPAACLYQRKNISSFRKSVEAGLRAAKLVR